MPWALMGGPGVAHAVMSLGISKKPDTPPKRRMRDLYRPLPVLAGSYSWPPFPGKRLAILVNLACNGITSHVAFGG